MPHSSENSLIVEGGEDLRVIPQLLEKNGLPWERGQEPVFIEALGSHSEILAPGEISARLKSSGLKRLGVVIDADEDASARWTALRNRCILEFPSLPTELPGGGVIVANSKGQKFGAWIMPDNKSRGMLETFLATLVPARDEDVIWQHAQDAATEARTKGARFTDPHSDKAYIHTWLAWNDPPGHQLHIAILTGALQANSPFAKPFVDWFMELYEL